MSVFRPVRKGGRKLEEKKKRTRKKMRKHGTKEKKGGNEIENLDGWAWGLMGGGWFGICVKVSAWSEG